MLKIYILILVLGLLGGVGYGAYYYYTDTQARIAILTENSAKLEQAASTQKQTIDVLIADAEKFAKQVLSFPYHQHLKKKDIEYICKKINEVLI